MIVRRFNSRERQVHGIREFATFKGGRTVYIPSTPQGGVDIPTAKVRDPFMITHDSCIGSLTINLQNILLRNRPQSKELSPSLFVLTSQSNISNSKTPLSITNYASSLGYYTMVDAAALAATSIVHISEYPIDAMAISFYKMFGYPTGVGALIVKKSFLEQLKRPWFAGGTVDVVQVPGNIVTKAKLPHEQFEVCDTFFNVPLLLKNHRTELSTTFNYQLLLMGCAFYPHIYPSSLCDFRRYLCI